MSLFRRKDGPTPEPRHGLGMMEELELIWTRVRTLALGAPVLLLVGFGAGEVANQILEIPTDATVRFTTEKEVPNIHLEAISNRMQTIAAEGSKTVDYVTMYREHVEPVEKVLRRRGLSDSRARRISWPLVQ